MSHTALLGSGHTCNKSCNWLIVFVILLNPISSLLLGLASNFTNHHYALGFRVFNKTFQNIDEIGSVERITANTNNGGLSQTKGTSLIDSLVSKSTRSTNDTNLSLSVNVSWNDSNLALA